MESFYQDMRSLNINNVAYIDISSIFKVADVGGYTFGINIEIPANDKFFDYSKIASWYGGIAKIIVDDMGDLLKALNGSFIMISDYDTHLETDGRFLGILLYSSKFNVASDKPVRVPFVGGIGVFIGDDGSIKFFIANNKKGLLIGSANELRANADKLAGLISEKLGININGDEFTHLLDSLDAVVKQLLSLDVFYYNTIKLWSQGYVQNPSLVGPYNVEVETG